MPHRCLKTLFSDFQRRPREFFHEKELHAHFYSLAREPLRTIKTQDAFEVHRLRYEYDSIWRYRGADGYKSRHADVGKTCNLDFAILRDDFVQNHDLLSVVNKDETGRAAIREQAEGDNFSPAIESGFEFKMAFLTRNRAVNPNDIDVPSILQDCRKLAQERVRNGYILVFSHGPSPDELQAEQIITACHQEFAQIHPEGNLTVYVVTPTEVFQTRTGERPPPTPEHKPQGGQQKTDERPEPPPPPTPPPQPEQRAVCERQHDDQLVVVIKPGPNNSRCHFYNNGNVDPLSESFLVPNNQLLPTEHPNYLGAIQPNAGQHYWHGEDEVVISGGGPQRSRVHIVNDPNNTFLVPNHELEPLQ